MRKTVQVKPFVNTALKSITWSYSKAKKKVYHPVYLLIGFNCSNTSTPLLMDNGKVLYANEEDFNNGKLGALVDHVIESKKYLAENLAKVLLNDSENLSFNAYIKALKRAQQNLFGIVRDYFISEAQTIAKQTIDINQFNLLDIPLLLESERQLLLFQKVVKHNPFFTYTARVLVALHAYQARGGIGPGYLTVYHWEHEYGRDKFKTCMQHVDDLISSNKAITDGLFPVGVVSRKFAVDFMPNWCAGERYAQAVDEIIDLMKINVGK